MRTRFLLTALLAIGLAPAAPAADEKSPSDHRVFELRTYYIGAPVYAHVGAHPSHAGLLEEVNGEAQRDAPPAPQGSQTT